MLKNPFIIYGYEGPDYFCDRKEETEKLIAALRNGRNVTLRSPRRLGKTGIIQHAFHYVQQQYPDIACFYVDIYATKTLDDFVQELGRTIIGKLDTPIQKAEGYIARFFKSCRLYLTPDILTGQPQLSLDIAPHQADTTLAEIFAYLKQSNRECFIAIDEFQQITEYPEGGLEAQLRKWVQQCSNVHFIFSGSKQHLMNNIFNSPKRPFYRSTEKMGLEPLPCHTYFLFAQQLLAKNNIVLTEDVFNLLYQRVDGITWYVQYILNKLYELHPVTITSNDIDLCIASIIEQEQDDYKKAYHLLTSNQAQVLKAVAKEGCVSSLTSKDFLRKYNLPAASSTHRAIDSLLDNEFVYKTDDGFVIYDRFFALWLQKR